MEYRYKPTTHGRSVMAACMDLEVPFHITRVAFGSGKVDEETNLADMHELLEYVTDGAVAERRHENDRFYLTIQFANKQHPEVKTFLLTEFIVYVKDPENGGETDLLYGTLGDYRQPVPGYNPAFPPSVFNFPLELILSDEISVAVSAPAGLVTHDELLRLLDELASGAAKRDLTIPVTGWMDNPEEDNPYPLCLDVPCGDVTETMIPLLNVLPSSLPAACACGFCPVSRTVNGLLRVYTRDVPARALEASLTVLETARNAHTGLSGSAVTDTAEIGVPTVGWVPDEDLGGAYAVHLDIADEAIQEHQVPMLTVLPGCLEDAWACGLSPAVRTLRGVLRMYAQRPPERVVRARLALLGTSSGVNVETVPAGDGYVLPAATALRLGGVKVGQGLRAAQDGTISLDMAEDAEIQRVLTEAFPSENK